MLGENTFDYNYNQICVGVVVALSALHSHILFSPSGKTHLNGASLQIQILALKAFETLEVFGPETFLILKPYLYLYLYLYSTYTSTAKIAKTEKQQNLKNLSKTSEHSKHCKGEAAESTSDWTIVPRVHNLKSIMVQRSAWDWSIG